MTVDLSSREEGDSFMPKFDLDGLASAIVQDAGDGTVLMLAHMNADAIAATRETGWATFWSRSRQELWVKGATSGNRLAVREIRVDCDLDALLLVCDPEGPACHTGRRSCFYRTLDGDSLSMIGS